VFGAWSQQQAGHLIALSQNSGFGFADSHGDRTFASPFGVLEN
jgi:hypothetical protein